MLKRQVRHFPTSSAAAQSITVVFQASQPVTVRWLAVDHSANQNSRTLISVAGDWSACSVSAYSTDRVGMHYVFGLCVRLCVRACVRMCFLADKLQILSMVSFFTTGGLNQGLVPLQFFSEQIAYVFLSSSIAFEIRAVRFYSRGAMLTRLLAMALCPCLCLSVCLSQVGVLSKGWTD